MLAYNPRVDTVTDLATNKIKGYRGISGYPGLFLCSASSCQTGMNFIAMNQAMTVTCSAPANNNGGTGVTTTLNSGFVEYAVYLVRRRDCLMPRVWLVKECRAPSL